MSLIRRDSRPKLSEFYSTPLGIANGIFSLQLASDSTRINDQKFQNETFL